MSVLIDNIIDVGCFPPNQQCPCGKGLPLAQEDAKRLLGMPEDILKTVIGVPFASYEYRSGEVLIYNCRHSVLTVYITHGVAAKVESYEDQRRYPRVKPDQVTKVNVQFGDGNEICGDLLDISIAALAMECLSPVYPEEGTVVAVDVEGMGSVAGRVYRVDPGSCRLVISFDPRGPSAVKGIKAFVDRRLTETCGA